jgi:hypothetical protein
MTNKISQLTRTELEDRLEKAEWALESNGFRRTCDIPACNCGNQWGHGGHASQRLWEISEALGDRTQGVTILDAVQLLVDLEDRRLASE